MCTGILNPEAAEDRRGFALDKTELGREPALEEGGVAVDPGDAIEFDIPGVAPVGVTPPPPEPPAESTSPGPTDEPETFDPDQLFRDMGRS